MARAQWSEYAHPTVRILRMMHDPTDTEARLHAAEAEVARLCAIVESIPAIKANVRDACTIRAAETGTPYLPASIEASVIRRVLTAIAAIDLGPL